MTKPIDLGWGWFDTGYSEVPEIQRFDDDPRSERWDDTMTAAYVLYQLAHKDPELFVRALETHIVAQILHYDGQVDEEDQARMEAYAKRLLDLDTFPDIPLPDVPPAWLTRILSKGLSA